MSTKLHQPVILISGGAAGSASVQAAATMISGAGAIPLIVTNHFDRVQGRLGDIDTEAARLLAMADGVLLMGNNGDIDASEFGETNHPKTNSELLKKDSEGKIVANEEGIARRNFETIVLKSALAAGMPMLGICGGEQRLNVLCKGTLIQHVAEQMRDAAHGEHAQQDFGIPPFVPVQPVTIKNGTSLASIAEDISVVYTPARTLENDIRLNVNSMHHQAVGKVGEGLRVAAVADDVLKDGSPLIEAIEADPNGKFGKQFIVGVQWHPEFSDNPLGAKLSQRFTAAAKEFAKATGREHTLEDIQQENRVSASAVLKPQTADMVARPDSMVARIMQQRGQPLSIAR